MLGPEVRSSQTIPEKPPTQAENLISIIKARLGNHYYLASHARTVSTNQTGLLLYREVSFIRRGLFDSNNQHLGAQTLLTLITDSQPIRALEEQNKMRKILSTPPTRINGWMPQDGRNLINQTIVPGDIPADVLAELEGVAYFATAETFAYVYQRISAQTFLADKLAQSEKG